VNTSTEVSGSKPRINTKKNINLPAKSENKKKVEDHPRTNKSAWIKVNRVDSSISSKRVVINSNSESMCKTCNKCLNSANHEMCVVNILSSVNATPTVKIVLNKGKQIWKPKGKLCDNSLNKTKRVWKATGKLIADIGRTGRLLVSGLRLFKTYDRESFKAQELCGKVHRDKVYDVEGPRTLIRSSVGQFVILIFDITFSCILCLCSLIWNGVGLLKGSRSTNLYTISLDDMMKSSPMLAYFIKSLFTSTPPIKTAVCRKDGNRLQLMDAADTMFDIIKSNDVSVAAATVATACYTQNRSLIHTRHNKTPYELMHDKKPDLTFLRVFGAHCLHTNDSEDLGKLQAKADIGIFVGYAPNRKGFRIYNKRTRRIMETIHVTFDELLQTMAPMSMTPGQFSSGLIPNMVNATNYVLPRDKDLELLFQPMFDEYFKVTRVDAPVPSATIPLVRYPPENS
ncbi:retrovirus-related pol polyprotein from transposon TNT 1-94, partial [Tanacetum coccineum]